MSLGIKENIEGALPLPDILPPESTEMEIREQPIKSGVAVQVTFIHNGQSQIRTAFIEFMEGYDPVRAAHRTLDKAIEKFLPPQSERVDNVNR